MAVEKTNHIYGLTSLSEPQKENLVLAVPNGNNHSMLANQFDLIAKEKFKNVHDRIFTLMGIRT